MVPLLARYRQALDLGEVVVLDGAGYSRENLRTLEGFSWILRVPATLKEARAPLEGEFPREAWTPLLPGYRGLEVERGYGGVRQSPPSGEKFVKKGAKPFPSRLGRRGVGTFPQGLLCGGV